MTESHVSPVRSISRNYIPSYSFSSISFLLSVCAPLCLCHTLRSSLAPTRLPVGRAMASLILLHALNTEISAVQAGLQRIACNLLGVCATSRLIVCYPKPPHRSRTLFRITMESPRDGSHRALEVPGMSFSWGFHSCDTAIVSDPGPISLVTSLSRRMAPMVAMPSPLRAPAPIKQQSTVCLICPLVSVWCLGAFHHSVVLVCCVQQDRTERFLVS